MTMQLKASKIKGLKVVTLDQGKVVDTINDIIYDPETNKVLALLVDPAGWFSDAKVIMFEDIYNVGEDAVMIKDDSAVKSAGQVEAKVKQIANSDTYLSKGKIVTVAGQELGRVTDIYFNSPDGQVTDFEVSEGALSDIQSGRKTVKISDIVTIGEDAIIVKEFTLVKLENQTDGGIQGAAKEVKSQAGTVLEQLQTKAQELAAQGQAKAQELVEQGKQKWEEIKNDPQVQQKVEQAKQTAQDAKQKAEEFGQKLQQKASETGQDVQQKAQELKQQGEQKVEQVKEQTYEQRKQSAIGWYLTKTILTPQDETIGTRGELITNEMFAKAEQFNLADQILNNVSQEPLAA
jgi:uncharacterized protein YrrD